MKSIRFCGDPVSEEQVQLICRTVKQFSALNRTELAATICEFLGWLRANEKPKTVECRQFLELLENQGILKLPAKKTEMIRKKKPISLTNASAETVQLAGQLKQFKPVQLKRITTKPDRQYFRELIERYHYLGYRRPFGAHLSYFIETTQPTNNIVGAIQISSPAWRMQARDQWIGWQDNVRANNLQRIINNSRFLILPSINIKCLASHVLSQLQKRITDDWLSAYNIKPLLLETLVDNKRFSGTCYRAANWIELGVTSGRGRDDRENVRQGLAPKTIFVYPLQADARTALKAA